MPAILERPPILDLPNPAGEALEQPPRDGHAAPAPLVTVPLSVGQDRCRRAD